MYRLRSITAERLHKGWPQIILTPAEGGGAALNYFWWVCNVETRCDSAISRAPDRILEPSHPPPFPRGEQLFLRERS